MENYDELEQQFMRLSGDPVKFRIGVIIGAIFLRFFDSRHIMIVAAVAFGVAGLVMLFVS